MRPRRKVARGVIATVMEENGETKLNQAMSNTTVTATAYGRAKTSGS